MTRRLGLILLFGVMLATLGVLSAFAGEPKAKDLPVQVTVNAAPRVVEIADPIRLSVTVAAQKDIEVENPDLPKSLGNFEVEDYSLKRGEAAGKKITTVQAYLTTYEPGKTKIPGFAVKYRKNNEKKWVTIETPEQEIEVKSLVGETATGADIRDIKKPVRVPSRHRWNALLIICALLALLLTALRRLTKKKAADVKIPARPAHEIAYEQLEALKNKWLIRAGKIKEYYSELSDIVRRYLENRFNLKAPEMTTEEFLIFARDYSVLQPAHKEALKDFLSSCDLVKFARYVPPLEDSQGAFNAAKKFVDETREVQGTV